MDNILITGGAGFIGSHLAQRLLREGKRLAIVDNLDDYYPADLKRANLEEVKASGEFQFFPTDIRDGEKLREVFAAFKPDAVIHLAARPGVRLSFAQPEAYTSINVLGTTQVLEISRQSGVRRFVFASSSSVYGHSSRAPFREDATITRIPFPSTPPPKLRVRPWPSPIRTLMPFRWFACASSRSMGPASGPTSPSANLPA